MAKQLPPWGKLVYGAGGGGFALIDRLMNTWLLYFYVIKPIRGDEALVSAMAFGVIMFLGRAVDAITDPVVARWSDNYQGHRGRRLPFMIYGGILYVAAFVALFYPPVAGESLLNSIYLTVLLAIYFILFTVYVTPYLALLPELARSTADRVDLATWKAVFSILGVAVAFIAGGILIGALGAYGMIWAMAAVGLLMLYLPVLIKEKDYSVSRPATLGLKDALRTTFRNRPFLIYLGGNVAFWMGFNVITLNLPGYVTVLLRGTEADTAIYFGLVLAVAFLGFPLVNILAKKLGLKVIMMFSLVTFTVVLPGFFFLGQPLFGLPYQVLAYILMALVGLPVAVIFIVPDAIVAAVSDLEVRLSGQRREAMYFGAQGFVLKLAIGLSTIITGALLQIFGSTAAQPLGLQLTGPVAAVFTLTGMIIFACYPQHEVVACQQNLVPGPSCHPG